MPVRKVAGVFVFSVILGAATLLAQSPQFWGVIGAVGIVDDGSVGLVSFSDTGSVFIRTSIASATAQLRYPVQPVGELTKVKDGQAAGFFCLDVLYRDTGPASRVIVNLKSLDGAAVITHLSFDSDRLPATGEAYVPTRNEVCGPRNADGSTMTFFDFSRHYYVEVLLMKGSSGANPGVKTITINDTQWHD
jgi:hypothetical protein